VPSNTVVAARQDDDTDLLVRTGLGRTLKVRSRAPLRLGLAGGGTDVSPFCELYGGIVLNATIDRYCHATLEWRGDESVMFVAPDLERSADLDSADACDLGLHAAVYRRLNREFDLGDPALTITTHSDAPPGSGLGSSSTLVVALIEAFREYFSLPLSEYEIASLAFDIERIDCGLAGGRQDQYAAAFGGFNMMEFGKDRVVVNPLRLKPAIVKEFEASLALYYTGASRCSAAIIASQSDHVWAGHEERLNATHALKSEALSMKDALLRGNLTMVAAILNAGWEAKKVLADGISNEAIEELIDIGRQAGALASMVSGAGGGGYLMFIVEPVQRPELLRQLGSLPGGRIEPVHFVEEGATAWTVR
jgi:D-glycero-alpha-D-manno-heptose-7-phosphate kinase